MGITYRDFVVISGWQTYLVASFHNTVFICEAEEVQDTEVEKLNAYL